MARVSAFRGNWAPNRRPYIVVAPDAYVAIQGETNVIVCGTCRRELNINKYLTGLSTEASVDSPPGSATVTLSIPDNDINDFYSEGELVIHPMMEIELFAKGYFTVGGYPQYYKIFWGMVSSITKAWSNGVTTVTLNCKDILRWWELTNVILNPGFIAGEGSSTGNFKMFANQFSGMNPYAVIIALAKDAMGDLSLTTGSFTSYKPELGAERRSVGRYAKDVMAYWQLKFSNIWNNLVLYGSTGRAYTFSGDLGDVSPAEMSSILFRVEKNDLALNEETTAFKIQPHEIAAFKVDVPRAVDFDFFQSESRSKLSIATTARDQILYEFYCDTTGDIVFKPPFYNMNVIPNKPVSWVQDFDILDDSITETEQEVYTHITSSGNAFGGVTSWGLNDDITTPRTGVVDFHLLRRYGWRRMDYQCEWAGNPKKLFYFLMDYLDRINAKRSNGTVTIPMRPELRMGFPVWIPKYDSFFYVNGISHNYSPGGQATSTLTLIAKRSKFVAPKNIGKIEEGKGKSYESNVKDKDGNKVRKSSSTYKIEFPSEVGATIGVSSEVTQGHDEPAVLRNPKTGKILGYPNVVMVFRRTPSEQTIAKLLGERGSTRSHKPNQQNKQRGQNATGQLDPSYNWRRVVKDTLRQLSNTRRSEVIARLRNSRYEAGYTTAGLYDYAEDVTKTFKEMAILPTDSVLWGTGCSSPLDWQGAISSDEAEGSKNHRKKQQTPDQSKQETPEEARETARRERVQRELESLQEQKAFYEKEKKENGKELKKVQRNFSGHLRKKYGGKRTGKNQYDQEDLQHQAIVDATKEQYELSKDNLARVEEQIQTLSQTRGLLKRMSSVNVLVRPVSDEFGFEVIGHQRYGRGVYIDRGQMRIVNPDTGRIANDLGIQFAATGGLLTDSPKSDLQGQTLEAIDFAEEYEKMQPDDYATGATITNRDNREDAINPTSARTYTDSINHQVADTGKVVYAEVDALRRSVTLGELRPTLTSGLDAIGWEDCKCGLSKTNWLSVLPQTFLDMILQPQTFEDVPVSYTKLNEKIRDIYLNPETGRETYDKYTVKTDASGNETVKRPNVLIGAEYKDSDGEVTREAFSQVTESQPITAVIDENSSVRQPDAFFRVLDIYLQQLFDANYQQNQEREKFDTQGDRPTTTVYSGPEADNILQPPGGGGLFNRAAQGDPEALEALEKGANFNFGRTVQAADAFNDALDDFKRSAPGTLAQLGGGLTNAATGGLIPQVSVGDENEQEKSEDAAREEAGVERPPGKPFPGAPDVQYQPPAPRQPDRPLPVPNLDGRPTSDERRPPRENIGLLTSDPVGYEPDDEPEVLDFIDGPVEE